MTFLSSSMGSLGLLLTSFSAPFPTTLQVSYLRSVFLAPNKAVFDVTKINIPDFSASLGLLVAPKLRFLKKAGKGTAWNAGAGPSSGFLWV